MPDTMASAAAKIRAIGEDLVNDQARQAYAEAILAEGKKRAAGHPTPQSRMAASGLTAKAGAISGAGVVWGHGGGAPLSDIMWGAEYGSAIYSQFGPRSSHGHWLYPAADDDRTIDHIERTYVEGVIEDHV